MRASTVTKTMILEHVWDYSFDPQTNVVDVLVHRLRAKVDPDRRRLHAPGSRLCPPARCLTVSAGPRGPAQPLVCVRLSGERDGPVLDSIPSWRATSKPGAAELDSRFLRYQRLAVTCRDVALQAAVRNDASQPGVTSFFCPVEPGRPAGSVRRSSTGGWPCVRG